MKDSLKDFIHQNRDGFDDQAPDEKAWKKIEATLPIAKKISLWNSVSMWRAAAILFLGLAAYFFTTTIQSPLEKKEVAKLQGDFSDIEVYYTTEIAEKVALINHLDESQEVDQFTQDFQKLDAMYQVLREQMKTQPSQRVKEALVLNLLVRIDLLNQLLYKLDQVEMKNRDEEGNA